MRLRKKSLRILLRKVVIGFLIQTLDATFVNTELPNMARSFDESPLRKQSLMVVTCSLTMTMLIPACGWIADSFGARCVYVSGFTLFVLGSIACALPRKLTEMAITWMLRNNSM